MNTLIPSTAPAPRDLFTRLLANVEPLIRTPGATRDIPVVDISPYQLAGYLQEVIAREQLTDRQVLSEARLPFDEFLLRVGDRAVFFKGAAGVLRSAWVIVFEGKLVACVEIIFDAGRVSYGPTVTTYDWIPCEKSEAIWTEVLGQSPYAWVTALLTPFLARSTQAFRWTKVKGKPRYALRRVGA